LPELEGGTRAVRVQWASYSGG